jgi:hypothetical protein
MSASLPGFTDGRILVPVQGGTVSIDPGTLLMVSGSAAFAVTAAE